MNDTAEKITVILGEYKGIKIPKMEASVSEEEVQAELKRAQQMAANKTPKDGPAEMGDEALIDFTGYMDDVAFPGGDGCDFPLVLGSGAFIPGFEEQLVGSRKGDTVDVHVSFPENYHAEEFAGRPAVFKVLIKELRSSVLPELDDALASSVSNCKTLDEFIQYIKDEIRTHKEEDIAIQKENIVVEQLMKNSSVTVPEKDIQTAAENLKQGFINQLRNSGQTIEAYLEYEHMTQQQFEDSAVRQAEHMIKSQAILAEIAARENITVSDEEVEREVYHMSIGYQMEQDKLKDMLGERGMMLIRKDIAGGKAMNWLIENADEV